MMVTVTAATTGLITAREARTSTNTRPLKMLHTLMVAMSTGIFTTTTPGTPVQKTISGSTATGVIAAYSHRPKDLCEGSCKRWLLLLDDQKQRKGRIK
jgi:hypothetical protein